MTIKNLKIEITPSHGYVLSKKIDEKWEIYYTIAGPAQNSCKTCGYPLKKDEECKHHQGLENLKIEYSIQFVGYYQTDFKGYPLNKFTKRILKIRAAEGEKYYQELLFILNSLFRNIKNKIEINWGSWVPTSNTLLMRIAQDFMQYNHIRIINPLEIIEIDNQINRIDDKKEYVLKKYKIKEACNPKTIKIINNNIGVILDDLLHTGYTIGRIFELFQEYHPKKLLGLLFARTSRGKHPIFLKYPNFP